MAIISTVSKGLFMINVVVISNNPTQDLGLLSQNDDMQIVKVLPTTIEHIIEQVGTHQPDIIIIADSTPQNSCDKLCQFLGKHYHYARSLVLTDFSPTFEMLENSGFKARGYITPDQHKALAKAVRVVFDGEAWLPRKLVTEILNRLSTSFFDGNNNDNAKFSTRTPTI